jgi:hypothetical protein
MGHSVAREQVPVEQLEQLAKTFQQIGTDISNAAASMRKGSMPSALLHCKTVANTRVPELLDWAATVETNVKSQLAAFKLGVASQAQIEKNAANRRREQATDPQQVGSAPKKPKKGGP